MFKKLAALATAGIMLASFQLSAFASSPEYVADDEFVTEELIERQKEVTQRTIEEGNQIREQMRRGVVPRETRTLRISRLSQHNPDWNDLYFPCGHTTYGKAGCALTCYAMLTRFSKGNAETPVSFATTYNTKYGDPCYQEVKKAAAIVEMSVSAVADEYPSRSTMDAVVYSAITNGNPVMIRVTSTKYPSHYVVAYGFAYDPGTDSTTVYIRDPEDRNYTTMSQYYLNGYKVKEYAVFAK